ncbi:HAAS signaling domain-containing protein [Microlunatus ginsengisoli]|uniref:DUF1700 domain-containing protein n=1 Tax=Microlunatus ginsengisoli TaxID=363863 RepID=A0ABP7AUB2_9ACTN
MAEHLVTSAQPLDDYLAALRRRLGGRPDRDDLVAEIEDHLRESVERGCEHGLDRVQAEFQAIDRLGEARALARRLCRLPARLSAGGPWGRASGRIATIAALWWPAVALTYLAMAFDPTESPVLYQTWCALTAVGIALAATTLFLVSAASVRRRLVVLVLALPAAVGVAWQAWGEVGWFWPLPTLLVAVLALGLQAVPAARLLVGRLPLVVLAAGWLLGAALAMATPYVRLGPMDSYGYAILPALLGFGLGACATVLSLGVLAARVSWRCPATTTG